MIVFRSPASPTREVPARNLIAVLTIGVVILVGIGCDLANVPIEVVPAESHLVVASLVGPENTILVTVSRSFSALSATDADSLSNDFVGRLLVDSASVVLAHGDAVDTLRNVFDTPGLYGGALSSDQNQVFRLSVLDPLTGQTVSATTMRMPPVALRAATYSTELGSSGDTTTVLSYEFDDLPGESYYVLHAYNLPDDSSLDSLLFGAGDELSPLLSQRDLVFYEALLLDSSFDGPVIADTVRIPQYVANESIVLSLSHVSEGYFRFLQARRRSGGLLSSLSNEPVNHPTNVIGGYGYFTIHRPRAMTVDRTNE